jgi:hypothetical protein
MLHKCADPRYFNGIYSRFKIEKQSSRKDIVSPIAGENLRADKRLQM